MHPILLLQFLAHVLVIGGLVLVFIFRRHLMLNSQTPSTGKNLGYVGALSVLAGLLAELVIYGYSILSFEGL